LTLLLFPSLGAGTSGALVAAVVVVSESLLLSFAVLVLSLLRVLIPPRSRWRNRRRWWCVFWFGACNTLAPATTLPSHKLYNYPAKRRVCIE